MAAAALPLFTSLHGLGLDLVRLTVAALTVSGLPVSPGMEPTSPQAQPGPQGLPLESTPRAPAERESGPQNTKILRILQILQDLLTNSTDSKDSTDSNKPMP